MLLKEQIAEVKHTQLWPDGDSFRMRVPVLQADVENANRRRYPFAVVQAAVEDLRAKLKKRTAYGSTKHEKDLEVDAVSHIIEDIELDGKGLASAIIRIFPTQRGKNLAAIVRGGGALGVSARGFGDVDERGNVKPGYRLAGVDFVTDPSFNFHVGKECAMFESREVESTDSLAKNPLTKEQLADKYLFALSAGYRGTFQQYCESLNLKKG